jgi:hypothetical protein
MPRHRRPFCPATATTLPLAAGTPALARRLVKRKIFGEAQEFRGCFLLLQLATGRVILDRARENMILEHDPEKWTSGFPKRSCSNRIVT